jgi:hypothetical protein
MGTRRIKIFLNYIFRILVGTDYNPSSYITVPKYLPGTDNRSSPQLAGKLNAETRLGASLLLLLGMFFFFSGFAKAQSLNIAELSIDTNYLKLGQQTILKFSVTCNKDRKPIIPIWKNVLDGKLDIISAGNADTIALTDWQLKIRQELVVAKFNEDTSVIDSLFIPLVKNKDTIFIQCDDLKIYPISEKVDMEHGIRDIKSPEDIPYTFQEILPYALAILAVILFCLIVYLVIYFIRKARKKKVIVEAIPEPEPKIPADIIALEKLNKLKAEEKWFTTDSKAYLTELTDILREYIYNRWDFDAQESTSEEILAAEFILKVDHVHLQNLKDILSTADFVKFAKANTGPDENKAMLTKALVFVETTALPPEMNSPTNV